MKLRIKPITFAASVVTDEFTEEYSNNQIRRAYARIEPARETDRDGEMVTHESSAWLRLGALTVEVGLERLTAAIGGEACWVPADGTSYHALYRLLFETIGTVDGTLEFEMEGSKRRVGVLGKDVVMERYHLDAHDAPTWEEFYRATPSTVPYRVMEVLLAVHAYLVEKTRTVADE